MVGTIVATFFRCIVVTQWLPHTPVFKKNCFFLEVYKVWLYLSTLSIQTRAFIET